MPRIEGKMVLLALLASLLLITILSVAMGRERLFSCEYMKEAITRNLESAATHDVEEAEEPVSIHDYRRNTSVGYVLDCLGPPDLYQASVDREFNTGKDFMNGSLWYLDEGLVVSFREPFRNAWQVEPSIPVDSLYLGAPDDDIDSFYARVMPRGDVPSVRAHWVSRLQPWPGELNQLTLEDRRDESP